MKKIILSSFLSFVVSLTSFSQQAIDSVFVLIDSVEYEYDENNPDMYILDFNSFTLTKPLLLNDFHNLSYSGFIRATRNPSTGFWMSPNGKEIYLCSPDINVHLPSMKYREITGWEAVAKSLIFIGGAMNNVYQYRKQQK